MIDKEKVISNKAKKMQESGIEPYFGLISKIGNCINLTLGEPNFITPTKILHTGIKSLENGQTYYTANLGLKDLRESISNYLNRRFHLEYDPYNEVVVTVGASEAIDLAIRTLVEDGDEVIIPEPCFVSYAPIVTLVGGTVVNIPLIRSNDFKLKLDDLKRAITPKTKVLILPFPNNPIGSIMEKEDLKEIAEFIQETNILVISDEIYAELTYTEEGHTSIASIKGMKERCVVLNGFSKSHAMTGWRLGYACGPSYIINTMNKIHQNTIMSAPTTSQYAAIEALDHCDEDVEYMKNEYDKRRKFLLDTFREYELNLFEPLGAFYFFLDIRHTHLSSEEVCKRLLTEHKVALIPGSVFGTSGEGFVRISYANSTETLELGAKKILTFLSSYPSNI